MLTATDLASAAHTPSSIPPAIRIEMILLIVVSVIVNAMQTAPHNTAGKVMSVTFFTAIGVAAVALLVFGA